MKQAWLKWAAAGCMVWQAVSMAHAQQAWPSRPIQIVVPAPPGGAYDTTIRPLAQQMSTILGQSLVIENKPSAGNILGTQAGANAKPDGYTLTMTGMVNAIADGLYTKVPFDITQDFEHIGSIGAAAQWLVVRADAPYEKLADLVAAAKSKPTEINYASSGVGSTGHLIIELLQKEADIQFTHIPYRGGAPAVQDLLAGVVSVTVVPPNTAIPHIKNGAMRVLASSMPQRDPVHTDVPTFIELGYPTVVATSWVGLSAPKGTPEPIVSKLVDAMHQALQVPAIRERLIADGMNPLELSPQQYRDLIISDTKKWGDLTRALNITAQ